MNTTGSRVMKADIVDAIADYLIGDHVALIAENRDLRDKLGEAVQLLAKLYAPEHYPKGGYSSDIRAEWAALLENTA